MADNYDPDSPLLGALWRVVELSERDVSAQIPINFVTHPSVSLSAACFGNGIYEDQAATKCIANLLTVGYRRLIVDLYWSPERQQWTFCPVAVPLNVVGASTQETTPVSSASPAVLSAGEISDVITTAEGSAQSSTTGPSPTSTSEISGEKERRQAGGPTTTSPDAVQGAVMASGPSRSPVYKLGPYSCTQSLDVVTMINILVEYFQETEDTVRAHIIYLDLNLHAAASAETPDQPAPSLSGAQLPPESMLIGSLMDASLSTYIYSPPQLLRDRSNLNHSWYSVLEKDMPIAEYFITEEDSNGYYSTPDGWPCENYVQEVKAKRLLLGWGSVDPQIEGYNFTSDSDVIFPQHYLRSNIDIKADPDESLQSGCLFKPGVTDVAGVNSSWAVSSGIPVPTGANLTDSLMRLSSLVRNLTACGISPTLNDTLFGKTADSDVGLYRNVSLSSTWSWAFGEPRNSSSQATDSNDDRCAIMDVTRSGHWRAAACAEERHAACRVGNSPYKWVLTSNKVSYLAAQNECPEDTEFSVPRTGLENMYLYNYLLSQPKDMINPSDDDTDKREVWLNFNSLDVESCWVTGGPNVTCPYAISSDTQRRTVIVPTIAAIVILIITALTLFVKCNANRRNSRRKKRVIEGWEYEGVPS
ncbi:hypothetical protein VTN00DRAFT_6956 [Thermoascus crustaceus]|uniref:uncharacterized protein n=1 Tax=Thermoascus crustaceus TaxID=5088 RepID=UPI0037427A6B